MVSETDDRLPSDLLSLTRIIFVAKRSICLSQCQFLYKYLNSYKCVNQILLLKTQVSVVVYYILIIVHNTIICISLSLFEVSLRYLPTVGVYFENGNIAAVVCNKSLT